MSRPARVLHVLKYYRPRFTGEGAFMERCTGFMQVLAPDVQHDLLVTVTPEPPEPPRTCSTLNRIYYLSRRPLTAWRQEAALVVWFLRHLHRYDTVHIRTHADWCFFSYVLTKLFRRRLVLSSTLDDSIPVLVSRYRSSRHSVVYRLFRLFDAVISINPRLHAESSQVIPPGRCHLIPCGINDPRPDPAARSAIRSQLGIPENALVLIFVGALNRRKDPLLLIRTLPEILRVHPETFLLMVGPEIDPVYAKEFHAVIERDGTGDHIRFVGEVSDVHSYFQAADIMTFGSHQEGFGMVVPEAQVNGLPVVVRHLPGVNDLFVTNETTGLFFNDEPGYLSAVLRLAADPQLRCRIGSRARDYVRATFDMARVAQRYLQIYDLPLDGASDRLRVDAPEWEDIRQLGCSASVVDKRLHAPTHVQCSTPPLIVTLIDAEEAFDWNSQPFQRAAADVRSMAEQFLAHRVFERYGVVPTYLIDYPVAVQEDGCAPLRELLQDRKCDVGAQLHAWVTPPLIEELTARNTYPGNLPVALEYEKLNVLTRAIEDGLDVRPRIYRAGRFGAGPRTGDILRQLGYLADSSVMPCWSFARQGGPDYLGFGSTAPYWVDAERTILEIPSTAGFVGSLADPSAVLRRALFSRFSETMHWPALMSRLGFLERIRLTPEGILIDEAKRLVRHLSAQGQKIFVLTYHTPSLLPGCTPYVRTPDDLTRFLAWLDAFYDFFQRDLGGRPATWREVHDLCRAETRAEPAVTQMAPA
ncbi:MAG TPA: glycosyltransferase [Acetobacteraceae bacterium]